MNRLIDALKQIPDPRQARGRSHPLWLILIFIIMGSMAGYHGYRPLVSFMDEHYQELCDVLGVEFKKPSYSTFRRIMMNLSLVDALPPLGPWLESRWGQLWPDNGTACIDGKRICQSLEDETGKKRFVGLVSLFTQEDGITLRVKELSEEDNSEIIAAQQLLDECPYSGLVITMDALHGQKNVGEGACQWQRLSSDGQK